MISPIIEIECKCGEKHRLDLDAIWRLLGWVKSSHRAYRRKTSEKKDRRGR